MTSRVLLLITMLLSATVVNAEYRFTFTNPTIGDSQAPMVLEYFSAADCGYCFIFEKDILPTLLRYVEHGQLRIVFRDVPPSNNITTVANDLFCLQELPDYVGTRLSYKRDDLVLHSVSATLRGKAAARYQQCQETMASLPVLSHNQNALRQEGFSGTPSFLLTNRSSSNSHTTRWHGLATTSQLSDALATTVNHQAKEK